MADRISKIYANACKKGVLNPEKQSEDWFRKQISTEKGQKSFYDFATQNGMKFHPYEEWQQRLNDPIDDQPAQASAPSAPDAPAYQAPQDMRPSFKDHKAPTNAAEEEANMRLQEETNRIALGQEPSAEQKQPSAWQTFYKGIGAGAINTANGLLRFLNRANSAQIANDPMTLQMMAKHGKSPEEIAQAADATRARLDKAENERYDAWKAKADQLSAESKPDGGEKTFTDYISEGKIGKALQLGLGTAAESLPYTASALNPVATAAMIMSMSEQNYRQSLEDNPDMSEGKRIASAVGNAAIEMAVEHIGNPFKVFKAGKLTAPTATKWIKDVVKQSKDNIYKGILRVLGFGAKEAAKEGGEEVITTAGQDLYNTLLDWKDTNGIGLNSQWERAKQTNPQITPEQFALDKAEGLTNDFIGGALSGMMMSGPSTGVGLVQNAKYYSKNGGSEASRTQAQQQLAVLQQLSEEFGVSQEQVAQAIVDYQAEKELTPDQQAIINRGEELITAIQSARQAEQPAQPEQAPQDRQAQLRQQATEAAQQEIQSIAHKDGNVYRVGIKGKDGVEGYAMSGALDIQLAQDGTLSTRGHNLITIKMTDGTVEQVPAEEVTLLDDPASAADRVQAVADHLFAQYANNDLFQIGDKVHIMQNGQPIAESSTIVNITDEGVEVEIIDPNGQPNTTVIPHEQAAEMLSKDETGTEDGIVTFNTPDGELRLRQTAEGVYETIAPPYAVFEESDLANMGAVRAETAPPVESAPNGQSSSPITTDENGNEASVAAPAYPTDEEGNPAWNQIEVPQAAQILYDTFKQNNTAAQSYAEDQLKEAEKVQKQAAKQKSHSLNIAQRIAEDEQNAAFKAASDAAVKYWQDVKLAIGQINTAEEQAAKEAQQLAMQQAREQRSHTEEGTTANATMAERYNAAPKIIGNAGTTTLPDGRELAGHYVLIAPQGVTTSHDVTKNFQRSEGYPVTSNGQSINDRDYTSDKEEQQKVVSIAQNFNGNAIKNMPVISDEGLVYNGNGRMMAGQLAAINGTDAAYTQSLMNNAAQYGFTPEQVASIPNARVVFQLGERLPYSTQSLAIFNEQETQTQSNTGKAAGYARKLTPQAVSEVLAAVDGFNTIDAFFSDKKAPFNLINSLINAGIIAQREKAEMVDGDKLSATGRERLSNILFGTVFDNETIRLMGDDAALKNSILRALPQILDNKSLGEFSLESDINDAIRLLYQVRNSGMPFRSFVSQTVIAEDGQVHTAAENYSPYQLLLAEEMSEGGVDAFRDVLTAYNNEAQNVQGGQVDIFGDLLTQTELKNLILQRYGKEPNEQERPSASRQNDNSAEGTPASNEPAAEVTETPATEDQNQVDEHQSENRSASIGKTMPNDAQNDAEGQQPATEEKTAADFLNEALVEVSQGNVPANIIIDETTIRDEEDSAEMDARLLIDGKPSNLSVTIFDQSLGSRGGYDPANMVKFYPFDDTDNWSWEKADMLAEQFNKGRTKEDGFASVLDESDAVYFRNMQAAIDFANFVNSEAANSPEVRLALAEAETDPNPTEAQKKAENYKQGHVTLWGLPITIENPKGSIRRGTDANGKQWEQEMHHTYGKIRRTEGVDGDHIDVFIGPNLYSDKVFVVDQRNVDTGEFDEHKCMLGFDSLEDAQNGYLSNYEEGWQGMGPVTEVTMDEFKKWIDSSHRKTKPFSDYKSVKAEGAASTAIEDPDAMREELADELRKFDMGESSPMDENLVYDTDDMRKAVTDILKRYNSPKLQAAMDAITATLERQRAAGAEWLDAEDEEQALVDTVREVVGDKATSVEDRSLYEQAKANKAAAERGKPVSKMKKDEILAELDQYAQDNLFDMTPRMAKRILSLAKKYGKNLPVLLANMADNAAILNGENSNKVTKNAKNGKKSEENDEKNWINRKNFVSLHRQMVEEAAAENGQTLTDEEKKNWDWLSDNIIRIVDEYKKANGNVLDPDAAREYFSPIGYDGSNVPQYRTLEKALVDALYSEMLDEALAQGKTKLVLLTGHGGAGKSTATRDNKRVQALKKEAGLVFDAAMNSFKSLNLRILQAIGDHGVKQEDITIIPVYNDAVTSFENTLKRGIKTGRVLSIKYILNDAFAENVGKLAKVHEKYPQIAITPIDNAENNGGRDASIDDALQWDYDVTESLINQILDKYEQYIKKGGLTPNQIATISDGLSDVEVTGGGVVTPSLQSRLERIGEGIYGEVGDGKDARPEVSGSVRRPVEGKFKAGDKVIYKKKYPAEVIERNADGTYILEHPNNLMMPVRVMNAQESDIEPNNPPSGPAPTKPTRKQKQTTEQLGTNNSEIISKQPRNQQQANFESNLVFTADAVAEARKRLAARHNRLNMGLNPEDAYDYTIIAGAYVEQGVRKFADFCKAMIQDLGDAVRPYLQSIYDSLRHDPQVKAQGWNKDFDSHDVVDNFDVDNFAVEEEQPAEEEKVRTPEEIAISNMLGTITKSKHTKTGEDLYVVSIPQRVSDDEFKALKARAKANNGYYSSFAKNRGFVFKDYEDAKRFNTINDEEITDAQTSANTETVISQAETIAATAETIETPEQVAPEVTPEAKEEQVTEVQQVIEQVDDAVEQINDQLAVLGYYEADTSDLFKFHESYGFLKSAEAKAVRDCDRLAKQLASDLGVEVNKRKKLATANIAPAGGDISFRLPIKDGIELYVHLGINLNRGLYYKPDGIQDSYVISDMYWRVENPNASGSPRYLTGNQNYGSLYGPYGQTFPTYEKLLKDIRYYAKDYLPKVEEASAPVEHMSDLLEEAKKRKAASDKRKKDKTRIPDGQQVLSLFDDAVEDLTEAARREEQEEKDVPQGQVLLKNGELRHILMISHKHDLTIEGSVPTLESIMTTDGESYKPEEIIAYNQDGTVKQLNDNNNGNINESTEGASRTTPEGVNEVGSNGTESDGGQQTGTAQGTSGSRNIGRLAESDAGQNGGETQQPTATGTEQPRSKRGGASGTAGGVSSGNVVEDPTVEHGERRADDGSLRTPKEKDTPKNTRNYLYPEDAGEIDNMSPMERLETNVEALEVLRTLLTEEREATPEERATLGKLRGWGGINVPDNYTARFTPLAMNPLQKRLVAVVNALDTNGERKLLDSLRTASLTSYYTPIPIARAMHAIAEQAGYKGNGNMLDPSMGNGVFEGSMAKGVQQSTNIRCVELDWLTGQIAQKLYPDARINITGFQDAHIPQDYYDYVVSNIPFGSLQITDLDWQKNPSPIRKAAQGKIHNYFAVKMIESTRPGGLCVIMTSNAIMDTAGNDIIRKYITDNCEVLGAVRLPNNTFKGAGTRVVTDVIYLRKFRNAEERIQMMNRSDYWEDIATPFNYTEPQALEDKNGATHQVRYSKYYQQHPENIIGTPVAGGQYSDEAYDQESNLSADELAQQLETIGRRFMDDRKKRFGNITVNTTTPRAEIQERIKERYKGNGRYESSGNIVVQDGKIGKLDGTKEGNMTQLMFAEQKLGSATVAQVTDYANLRSLLKQLINVQIENYTSDRIEEVRKQMQQAYTAYTKKYGKLCEKKNAFIEEDIDGYQVRALEQWKDGKFVGMADIYTKNTIASERDMNDVSDPQSAVLNSLAEYGNINTEYLQRVLGDKFADACKGLIFEDPSHHGEYIARDVYLSGDVVTKLEYARNMAEEDSRFQENVTALEAIQPKRKEFGEFPCHMGARWIPVQIYNDFLNEIFGVHGNWKGQKTGITYVDATNEYIFNFVPSEFGGNAAKYATSRKSASDIFQAALLDKDITVKYKDDEGKEHTDQEATDAARDKVAELREAFEDWVPQKPERVQQLTDTYNSVFNRHVLPTYNGQHLNIVGLQGMKLRPHQKDAVWRIINQRGGIVDHIVGAGKSLVMQASIMEMRRMGIAKKPMILALKSTTQQIANEFRQAFPAARVLAPTEADFSMQNRKRFLAQIAVNDYDCIILSHEQYSALDHTEAIKRSFIEDQIAQLDNLLEYLYGQKDESQLTKKQIKGLEKRKENLKERLKKLELIRTDEEFVFENLGVDYLFVDECQAFKNLMFQTSYSQIAGLGNPEGSERSTKLLYGVRALQEMHQGDMGTVFLSGTTITNSLSELYNIFNYLRPNEMARMGLNTFDAWASTFAVRSTEAEFGATNELKEKSRFRKFEGLQELSRLYTEIADVRNDNNLELPKPKLHTVFVSIPISDTMKTINDAITDMVKNHNGSFFNIKPEREDKYPWSLSATNLAKLATLSPKLIDPSYDDENGKIFHVCENIKKIYDQFDKQKGVQLVFCDAGVPGPGKKYDAYTDIIRRLTRDYGIPRSEIADIHEAGDDAKRQALFKKVNEGKVRIVIGGTKNMGTGVNVQQRVVAMHHLDIPWTPADVNQRNGRGSRQGNEIARDYNNNQVDAYYYAVERTLDTYRYQLQDVKGKMIDSFKMANVGVNEFDEGGGDDNMSPAEMVAILSGNPVILDKAKQDKLVDKLKRLQRSSVTEYARRKSEYELLQKSQSTMQDIIRRNAEDIDTLKRNGYEQDAEGNWPTLHPVLSEYERVSSGKTFEKPTELGAAIHARIKETGTAYLYAAGISAKVIPYVDSYGETKLGEYELQSQTYSDVRYTVKLSYNDTAAGQAMQNLLRKIYSNAEVYKRRLEEVSNKLEGADPGEYSFPRQAELDAAIAKKREIDAEYNKLIVSDKKPKPTGEKPEKQLLNLDYDAELTDEQELATAALIEALNDNTDLDVFLATDEDIPEDAEFSIRRESAPKKTGIGYKVFYRGKDGKLYPPMVANPNGADTPVGVWLNADASPVVGETKTVRPQVKAGGKGTQGGSGTLAYRPGWHLGEIPYALQFNRKDENGEKTLFPKDFVWAEVEYAADNYYQDEAMRKGVNASGKFQHSLAGLKHVPTDGYYRYRTNPNPKTDPWIITGAMKVNRVLTNEEVDEIVRAAGREPQVREAMLTPNGTLYGWAIGDRIYLTKDGLNPNTPIHEYTHLWAKAMRRNNQEGWQSIVNIFKDTPFWDEVVNDPNYQGLTTDDAICSEVLARYSGTRGAARMEEAAAEILHESDQSGDLLTFARTKRLISRVRQALSDFWHWVGTNLFGIKHFDSAEQVADRVLFDMLNGTNLQSNEMFYSNAERTVEGISQEKATPQQWRAMIENAGGLKAGEDKWLGLSDWLSEQSGTITKQQVLDYIRANKIQIEETEYQSVGEQFAKLKLEYEDVYEEMRDRDENGDKNWADYEREAMDEMERRHGVEFKKAFRADSWKLIPSTTSSTAKYFGVNPINSTRERYTTSSLDNKREIALTVPTIDPWNEDDNVHFGDAGNGRAIAWVRFGDYKWDHSTLVIDEIQSKRHQDAREQGYISSEQAEEFERLRNAAQQASKEHIDFMEEVWNKYKDTFETRGEMLENMPEEDYQKLIKLRDRDAKATEEFQAMRDSLPANGVPAAPFEKNWHEFAMKRILRYAAENGYKRIAWTSGLVQAKRYGMSSTLLDVYYRNHDDGTIEISCLINKPYTFGHGYSLEEVNYNSIEEASKELGSDVIQKIKDGYGHNRYSHHNENDWMYFSGRKAKMSTKGMSSFYDEILPRFMQKYGRKWGAKLGEMEIGYDKYHTVDITDAMRESVMAGQPMFSISKWTPEQMRAIQEWNEAHPHPQYQVGEKLDHYEHRLSQWEEARKQFRASMSSAKPSAEEAEKADRPVAAGTPAFVPGVKPTPTADESPAEYALRLKQYYQLMRDENLVADYVAEINNQADAAANGLKKNTLVRGLLDAAKPIENFQEWMAQRGATMTDGSNAYTDTFLASGRVSQSHEKLTRDILRPLAKQIATIIAPDKATGKSRLDGVNITWQNMDVPGTGSKIDGKALTPREIIGVYCQAKDCAEAIEKGLPDRGAKGFERNLGMTHDQIISEVESRIPRAELGEMWRLINAATHFALNYDYESGRISEDTHTEFYQREFYVPQRGWRERDESGLITEYEPVGKRGNDPYNAALVKAHGRQSLAADPFAYIMSIDASSIISSENNKIKQKFLRFCLDNEYLGLKTGAFRVKKYWIMNVIDPDTGRIKLDADGNPMMEVSYSAPSTEDMHHDKETKQQIQEKRKQLSKVRSAFEKQNEHGDMPESLQAAYETKIARIEKAIEDLENQMHIAWHATNTNISQRTSDEKKQHEVQVLLDGEKYVIELQDEKLANAINKKFKQHQESLFDTTQKMRNATRFMSAMLTQYNPEFAASNFARDYQVALATLMAEHRELVGPFMKYFATCQGAVWKYAFNDKVRDRETFANSDMGQYLREYFASGAPTGFSYMQDLKSLRRDFDAMVNESNVRRGIKGAVGVFAMLTEVSETAVRFAGFVAARKNGMGLNEAAYLSKELTTNFDRAGEVADTGWMAWFSFFRATLNGNLKFLKALKKIPLAYSIVAVLYFAMGMLNQFLNPDDPDDEIWASDYTRQSNFVLGKIRIPVAHFMRMFFGAGVNAAQWIQGNKTFGHAVYNTATFASNEMLPNYLNLLGNGTEWNSRTGSVDFTFTGLIQGAIPSTVSPITDVWFNRDFRGAAINLEPFTKAQEGKKDILMGKEHTLPIYKWLTQAVYEGVGGSMNTEYKSADPAWRSWLFDISPSSVEHVVEGYIPAGADMFITLGEAIYDAATGTPTSPDKWPFVRKFYNAYTPERAYMQQYYLLNGRVKEFKRVLDDYQKNDPAQYRLLRNSQQYRTYKQTESLVKSQSDNPTTADVRALIEANKLWLK